MSWTSLPQELRLQIACYLDRDSSKNLRLTSKANNTIATPKLFETVHLTPNSRSFDRAYEVGRARHLSKHVRAVVYHLGILEDVHNGFQAFRDDIIRMHRPSGSVEKITKDVLWKYNCFLEEMAGQREFATRNELNELKLVCTPFNALESITTVLDEDDPFSPPEDFIGRRTGVHSACSPEGMHFSNLFAAADGHSLTRIRGRSASWRCLTRLRGLADQTSLTRPLAVDCSKVKELGLGLFNSELLDFDTNVKLEVLQALGWVFQTCGSSHVETLELDFDEIPWEDAGQDLRPISKEVFSHSWFSLKKLTLGGIATTEDDLVAFLIRHSTTLRNLKLYDLEIVADISHSDDDDVDHVENPGSILSLFHRISTGLQLDTATIGGVFTNRMDEGWCVDIEHGGEQETCYWHRIERWLSRKEESPFPDYLLQGRYESISEESEALHRARKGGMREGRKLFSDESWNWDPDLMPTDGESQESWEEYP